MLKKIKIYIKSIFKKKEEEIIFHTSLDTLPIIQWIKLHESLKDGIPELRYLLKLDKTLTLPEISEYNIIKLAHAYNDIVYTIKSIDLRLKALHLIFQSTTEIANLTKTKNTLRKLKNMSNLKPLYDDCNQAFKHYASYIDDNYTGFIVPKIRLRDDYKEHFKKIYKHDIPREYQLLFNKLPEFSVKQQQIKEAYDITQKLIKEDKNNLYKLDSFIEVVVSNVFFNEFYVIEEDIISDINAHAEYIKKSYMKLKQYDQYIQDRAILFHIDRIQAKPEKVYNFYEEISNIGAWLESGMIDPFTTPVNYYEEQKELAHKKVEQSKPKANA